MIKSLEDDDVHEKRATVSPCVSEPGKDLSDSLSSMESKLNELLGWQFKIFSVLQSQGTASSQKSSVSCKDKSITWTSGVPAAEDVGKSSAPRLKRTKSKEGPILEEPVQESLATTPYRHKLQLRQYLGRSASRLISGAITPGQMVLPSSTRVSETDVPVKRDTWFQYVLLQVFEIFPLNPQSRIALSLDIVSVTFLFYDSIMVPFIISWGTRMEGYFFWSNWITAVFWTIDMCLNFVKSFTRDSEIVYEYKRIVYNYLKRRFTLDFLVVFFDWVSIIVEMVQDRREASSNNLFLIRFVRLLKVGRLLRLYPLMKTTRYIAIKDNLIRKAELLGLDAQAVFLATLLKLVVVILWLNHIASCIWIAIETSTFVEQKGDKTWQYIIADMHDGTSFDDTGISGGFLYSISYYWAVTTMFSGGSFLVPMTVTESVFASLYVMFGFLVASSMISSMATNLMAGHHANFENRHKLQKLRKYLLQRNIDPWLGGMITRQLQQRLSFQRRIVESDLPFLTTLSVNLREKLRLQLWTPAFTRQPLWRTLVYLDNQFTNNVIRGATETFTSEPGETLFDADSPMEQIFFLLYGTMQYTLQSVRIWDYGDDDDGFAPAEKISHFSHFSSCGPAILASEDGILETTNIFPYQQICEMALWVKWKTVGLMEAVEHTELLAVPVDLFANIAGASTTRVNHVLKAYARALVACVKDDCARGVTDLATVEHDAIVPLMSQDERVSMSMPALTALQLGGHLGRQYRLLHDEVLLGKCNLGQDETGEIVRVAKLVVMRLERADGCICVSLGDLTEEGASVNINLPGVKQKAMESLGASVDLILSKCFPGNIPETSVDKVEVDVELKPSAAYGISTKYVRTACHARILPSDFWHGGVLEFNWTHGIAECFATDLCVSGEIEQRVFAWMSESEFEILKNMGSDAHDLVKRWMQELDGHSSSI